MSRGSQLSRLGRHRYARAALTWGARIWLHRLRYPWSRLRRRFEWRARHVALPVVTSLDDVRAALAQITWTPDGPSRLFDAVVRPQTTWRLRRGDCDGFAALAAELLQQLDARHAPVLVTVALFPIHRSHTVCAFRSLEDPEHRELRVFDNARLVEERFGSFVEVAAYVARRGEQAISWNAVRPSDLRIVAGGRLPPVV